MSLSDFNIGYVGYFILADGSIVLGKVTGINYTSTTTPGYYTYDVIPDVRSIAYSPNLGWNSSARSISSILGDGTATFQARVDNVGSVVGLNDLPHSPSSGYIDIGYGFYLSHGLYRVVERGVLRGTGSLAYVATDVFGITRVGNEVFYTVNNTLFYKSTVPSTGELLLDVSLYAGGDAVYNATIVDGASVQLGTGALLAAATVTARPKAKGTLTSVAALTHSGMYSSGVETHAPPVAMQAVSTLTNKKSFGLGTLQATSTLAGSARMTTVISGSFGSMTALATSGWGSYSAISSSFGAMTATMGADALSSTFTYLTTGFEAMTGNVIGLTGENTLPSTMSMPSMAGLAADHPYAGIGGSFSAMGAQAGNVPPLGNYAALAGPGIGLFGTGYEVASNSADLSFTTPTISGISGGISSISAFDMVFDGTGSYLDTGGGTLNLFSITLSGSGTVFGTGSASLGLFTSTITGYGGGEAALMVPQFGVAGTGSYIPTGSGSLVFTTLSISGTGSLQTNNVGAITFPTPTMVWGFADLQAPAFVLSGTGSQQSDNALAYVLNITTGESTQYTNYPFSHIITISGKPYGVKSDGLYLLEGATDSGVEINGTIVTKESDMGSSDHSQNVPYIYLNSDSINTITPIIDSVQKGSFNSEFGGRRCRLARGNKGRYHRFKIEHIVKLEGISFDSEVQSRRVK